MSKRSGNPAKRSWDPIQVESINAAQARQLNAALGRTQGMLVEFGLSDGRKHHYAYRTKQKAKVALIFQNRLYNGFGLVFEDGSIHLSFKRNDRTAVRDWRHVQAIKNEVAGPEREAVEIYPPESQLVDAANEYHLWVLPEGHALSLGFASERSLLPEHNGLDNALYKQTGRAGARQRPWEEGIPTGLGLAPGNDDLVAEAKERSTCSTCLARTYRGEECVCDEGDAEVYEEVLQVLGAVDDGI